jgi:hypothetical protein
MMTALDYSWIILKKATLNHHRRQLSWLYQPHEGLAAFEFRMETVTRLLELSCILMML